MPSAIIRSLILLALTTFILIFIYHFSERHQYPYNTSIAAPPNTVNGPVYRTEKGSEIFILGMHHTGTSLAAGMLSLAGSYLASNNNITADVIMAVAKLENGSIIAKSGGHHTVYENGWLQKTNDIILDSEKSSWFWICNLFRTTDGTPVFTNSSSTTSRPLFRLIETLRANFTKWESKILSHAAAATSSSAPSIVIKDPRSALTMPAIASVLNPNVRR